MEVIAVNLASLAGLLDNINPTFIPTITLILSISILVFGIFENAKNYNIRSLNYHSCGLEINKLYNEVKKHLAKNNQEDFNDEVVLDSINERFETMLAQHENHESIDFHSFILDRQKDFKLTWKDRWEKRLILYYNSKLMYHALILLGPCIGLAYYVS